MVRRLSVATLLLACGCIPLDVLKTDNDTAMVSSSQFTTPAPVQLISRSAKPPAGSAEACIIVDKIGQQLVDANKQLGIKPLFSTIGAPDPEIFHQGTGAVYITESLVRQCKTEGQLAAVLSMELGKMISEREALVNPEDRDPPKRLPIVVPIGNAAQFTGTEQLYLAEVAQLDADKHRPARKIVPPDPAVLARKYLETAGFDSKDLVAVAPLLQAADKTYVLEKQFKGSVNLPVTTPK
jgi:hypothetical protein